MIGREKRGAGRLATAIFGIVIVILFAGCPARVHPSARSSSSPTPSAVVIPWAAIPPSEFPPAAYAQPTNSAGLKPCRPADLEGGYYTTDAAAGNDLVKLAFVDVGPIPCFVRGRPAIVLITAEGHVLPPSSGTTYFPDEGPRIILLKQGISLPSEDGILHPGMALLGFQFLDCNPNDAIRTVRIELPTGALAVHVNSDRIGSSQPQPCPSNLRGSSSVAVNNFQRPPPPSGESEFSLVSASVIAPGSWTAGTALRYVVTLTNQTTNPLPLPSGPCPTYSEELIASGVHELRTFALNCDGQELPSHGTLSFEMNIDVPQNIRGSVRLRWSLDPYRVDRPSAEIVLTAATPSA